MDHRTAFIVLFFFSPSVDSKPSLVTKREDLFAVIPDAGAPSAVTGCTIDLVFSLFYFQCCHRENAYCTLHSGGPVPLFMNSLPLLSASTCFSPLYVSVWYPMIFEKFQFFFFLLVHSEPIESLSSNLISCIAFPLPPTVSL